MTLLSAGILLTSLVLLVCAFFVATSKNLVHCVFWLAAVLLLTASLFVMLQAPFLAAIQIVLYTGGVITLMLFGVMLTQRKPDTNVPLDSHRKGPAALTAFALLAVLLSAIWQTPELAAMTRGTEVVGAAEVGQIFLTQQLLAFEVLSVLLLAAMIGAIVLVRKADP